MIRRKMIKGLWKLQAVVSAVAYFLDGMVLKIKGLRWKLEDEEGE